MALSINFPLWDNDWGLDRCANLSSTAPSNLLLINLSTWSPTCDWNMIGLASCSMGTLSRLSTNSSTKCALLIKKIYCKALNIKGLRQFFMAFSTVLSCCHIPPPPIPSAAYGNLSSYPLPWLRSASSYPLPWLRLAFDFCLFL